jgi:transposase
MTTAATHHEPGKTTEAPLCVAFARREKTWKLGFTTGHGQKPRERTVTARPQEGVLDEIAQAKRRMGLPESAGVVRGYAAGRAGVWLPRLLQGHGLTNPGVDSSALEVNRRRRRAKSAGLDVRKWLSLRRRSHHGERQGWQVVTVPSVEAEDHRPLPRDLATLKQERASPTTRIQGLLRSQGRRVTSLTKFPEPLEALRLGDGAPSPPGRRRRGLRVDAHHTVLSAQLAAVEAARRAQLQASTDARLAQGRQLMQLKGLGIKGAWLVVRAFCGWRAFKNRREVGGFAGCTPTPDQSGASAREPGITQSGNRHGRWMTTELAGSGLRFQPERAWRGWLRERCGSGGKRWRRMGMVAVARKCLMALWRFLETGGRPAGAVLKAGEALGCCGVTPRSGCWWRRPGTMPGLPSPPS